MGHNRDTANRDPLEESQRELTAHLFRRQSGQIVASLTRAFGSRYLDLIEDVVQEAFVKALQTWPFRGIPENPAAWLTLVARNRALDALRRDRSFDEKRPEIERVLLDSNPATFAMDDELALVFLCCHPGLSEESRIPLTLKTACGFGVGEIARAFLAQPTAIAQRLVRAKRQIRDQNLTLELPGDAGIRARLDSVLRAIYLMFNEGYASMDGEQLLREEMCDEAIRLCTLIADHPAISDPRAHALLALMYFLSARFPARVDESGALALLEEQDRRRWDQQRILHGVKHMGLSAAGEEMSAYHLQAEIAGLHMTSTNAWPRIAELYQALYELEPTPIVALNRAVAISFAAGPAAGLEAVAEVQNHPAMKDYGPLPAVLADLWRRAGDARRASSFYRMALERPCSSPERRFLERRLEEVSSSLPA